MRSKLGLMLVVLLSLSVAAWADDWNKDFAVSGKPEVIVETNDANLIVHSTADGKVSARVTTRGYRISEDDVRIDARQSGNRVEIDIKIPEHHSGWGNRSVRLELDVPRASDLNLHTRDGNVEASGVQGDLRINSGDGNLDLRDLGGSLVASTGDGNIRTEGRFELLDLHTGDGNITADANQGSHITSDWTLRTGDGSIELRLPSDARADLDAHTGDGKVVVDFSVETSGTLRENSIRGKINGGGRMLELRSGDGDLRIEKM